MSMTIREARDLVGLTQAELARLCQTHEPTPAIRQQDISDFETGEEPTVSQLVALIAALRSAGLRRLTAGDLLLSQGDATGVP